MNIKRIFICSVIIWIINSVFGMLTCGWLFNWVYMLPPNIWKDAASITAPLNMVISYLMGFGHALIFSFVFALLFKGIPGKGIVRGIIYGIIIWLVGSLFGIASMPVYMNISMVVVIYWIIQSIIMNSLNGLILGAIYKEKA